MKSTILKSVVLAAILSATGNPLYARGFEVVGNAVIPRQRVRLDGLQPGGRQRSMRRLHREHAAIATAIAAGEPRTARRAMRRHLSLAKARLSAETQG